MQTMNQAEVSAKLAAFDDPTAKEQQMVYRVWEDGEITLEKGGELFGQRSLHMIRPGYGSVSPELMPHMNYSGTHGYLFAVNRETAEAASAYLQSL
jgi:hypothetical protein